MKKQAGISTVGVVLLTAVVVGGGAGAFAWMQQQKLEQVRAELAETRLQLDAANKAANAARAQLAAVRKELDEQKAAFDLVRAERDSAKNLLEAERQHNERIRAELTMAREQLVMMLGRRPAAAAYPAPQAIQPQIIRVAPAATRGQAYGAPVQAQRPSTPQ